jgi:hypothetical protein
MRSVDRQAKQIGDDWAVEVKDQQVERAVTAAQKEYPDAIVEARHIVGHSTDAVLIQHPPDPENPAQMALGFGALEIKSPFRTD